LEQDQGWQAKGQKARALVAEMEAIGQRARASGFASAEYIFKLAVKAMAESA
jgi:hypothetical protein